MAQTLRPTERSYHTVICSTASAFKRLENDVVIVAALTDIEPDCHRGSAYAGISRARTRLHVILHRDCDERHREHASEWQERG